ncbi:MAG: LamG domain-containing protein [Solirubrobacteraceae bacterium]
MHERRARPLVGLDGSNDMVGLPNLPDSVDFTIEGWQQLSASAAGNNTLYGGGGTVRFMPRPAGYYLGVYLGGNEYVLQSSGASNTDAWVHWAVVRRAGSLDVYRNGIQVGSRTGLPATTPAKISGTIGRYGGVAYPTKGTIDEVAVYGTALDAAELRAHRDIGAG